MAKKDYTQMTDKQFKAESRNRTIKSWQKADRAERSEKNNNILSIVIAVLIIFAVIGVLSNRELLTFKGLLHLLQSCPSVPLDFLQINLEGTIPILAFLGTLVNAITFILTCIVNCLGMVIWFMRALFL